MDEAQDSQSVQIDQQDAGTQAQDGTDQTNEKLEAVKKNAMDALTPIIDSLDDVDPERKFDICMSAMKLTDNKQLAETALNCALQIPEKGTRAEALVELINELNYQQSN
jgi:hypothetical protein